MDTKETITALTGLDLSGFERLGDDQRMAVEGTVYDALWHVAQAGACTHERAEELITELHRSVGEIALAA